MDTKQPISLAVSGDAGSFSEEAGIMYSNREGFTPRLLYAIDMEGVLTAVEEGRATVGIFPVVNSRGGLVQTAFEAMGRHRFALVGELWMEVQQCLLAKPGVGLHLAKPGTTKSAITQIVSHPQAFSQCERYLKRCWDGTPLLDWEDTAKAARDLSSGALPTSSAVIAPARAAALYGLSILERGIQDQHPNLTTFIIVKQYASKHSAS